MRCLSRKFLCCWRNLRRGRKGALQMQAKPLLPIAVPVVLQSQALPLHCVAYCNRLSLAPPSAAGCVGSSADGSHALPTPRARRTPPPGSPGRPRPKAKAGLTRRTEVLDVLQPTLPFLLPFHCILSSNTGSPSWPQDWECEGLS